MDEKVKIQELIRISEEIRSEYSKSFDFLKYNEPLRDEKVDVLTENYLVFSKIKAYSRNPGAITEN